ncbi:MAG: vitamin B12 dependent-methionine synthase activation domain-containing protein [Paludibacteraceae bacterium]
MIPNKIGYTELLAINLREIAEFIDWKFFFHAWRLTGKYDDIATACDCASCKMGWLLKFDEKDRPKAEEALKLYKDAIDMLQEIFDGTLLQINAVIHLGAARAADDNIYFKTSDDEIVLPTLRQQHPSSDGFCYSLADFIGEKDDYAGAFATTVQGAEQLAEIFQKEDDVYRSILIKTLADRLAEAAAEWLHYKVRKIYWGYAEDENLSISDMLKTRFLGIRPAVGYPSLPDQSIIFELDKILHFNQIGISLTENGAMFPNASVCGIYISHPKSKYFMIGKIDETQLQDYARRRGKTASDIKKWLASNL